MLSCVRSNECSGTISTAYSSLTLMCACDFVGTLTSPQFQPKPPPATPARALSSAPLAAQSRGLHIMQCSVKFSVLLVVLSLAGEHLRLSPICSSRLYSSSSSSGTSASS
jgi:hypothetical protein